MVVARRVTGIAFVLSLGLSVVGLGAAAAEVTAVKPGTESGATVTKTGWWWKANDTSEVPPEASPGVDAVPPPSAPKNVPEGSMPVAAVLGDAEKVSAIEFALDAKAGSVASSFLLTLRESAEPAANAGADAETTSVVACPVTEAFWAPGEAGTWGSKPEYDDGLCQPGVRGKDGLWSFDLTSFAAQWLGTDNKTSGSVVLIEQVDEPASFQVVFDGVEQKGIGVQLVATPGTSTDGGTGSIDTGGAVGTGDSGAGSAGGFEPGLDSAGAESGADLSGVPAGSEVPVAAPGQAQAPQSQGAGGQPFLIAPSALEDVPNGIWILAPVVLGIAYLMMLALGPGGEPALVTTRRGVSRALERWRSSGRTAAGGAQ